MSQNEPTQISTSEILNCCKRISEQFIYALTLEFREQLATCSPDAKRRVLNTVTLYLLQEINWADPQAYRASLIMPDNYERLAQLEDKYHKWCEELHTFGSRPG